MNCKWEELTSEDFSKAVRDSGGVCVLPVGVIEKHGDHLPLGTDTLTVREACELALKKSPAILFPMYYFGQVHESKNYPGAIALRSELIIAILDNVCEEIARNGMKKIIIVNGHGGNGHILSHFAWSMLEEKRDFTVYLLRLEDYLGPVLESEDWKKQRQGDCDGHAGEFETSAVLSFRPDLVKMDRVSPKGGQPLGRLKHLPKLLTAMSWFADHPSQYGGDARFSTAEKGQYLLEQYAEKISIAVDAVRKDTITPELEAEFFAQIRHLS